MSGFRSILILAFGGLLWFTGCSCRPSNQPAQQPAPTNTIEEMEAQRRKRDAAREKKPDFELVDLQVMPSDEPARSGVKPQSHVKPGHWFGASQRMKANNFDFPKGDLEAECVDARVKPVRLPGNFELLTTRGVSLPKGQEKNASLVLYAPEPESRTSKLFFMSRLRPRGGGQQLEWQSELAIRMRAQENHFVVLADRADNYQFLKSLRFASPLLEGLQYINPPVDYHIKLPKGTQQIDLSSHPLTWSTVAYVVWDDFDPDILSITQQQALLDWLHWGGQLIINGPKTLDRLSSSFLADYLPARAGKTNTIRDEQIEQLNAYWSSSEGWKSPTDEQASQRRPILQNLTILDEDQRPLCIELKLSETARFSEHSADLVAEQSVGRGMIKITAFNLPHGTFRSWAAYDSFVNALLLNRPPRRFYVTNDGTVVEAWESPLNRDDPRTTSQVRYFSRDASSTKGRRRSKPKGNQELAETKPDEVAEESDRQAESFQHELSVVGKATYGANGFSQDATTGVAGWNDQSDVSQLAAAALQQSAGVEIPASSFVAKALGLYLLVLVPVNWLLFRLIGRVEWAWAMIPLISIGGAVGVLRATQLDIGFVRSRTEVAILEMQPGYDRAHVTRYIGFYTSLASTYQITGEDESSLMLPLATNQRSEPNVELQFGDSVEMKGFNILSSSTGMIHTEQMLNVGGAITWDVDQDQVRNGSNLDLSGVVVVRRTSPSEVEWAGIGELKAQATHDAKFKTLTTQHIEFPGWEDSSTTSLQVGDDGLNVREILDLAIAPDRLGVDEMVMVGWTEKLIPGITVAPNASQVVARSVVVAQLQHAQRPTPRPDSNSYYVQRQIAKEKTDDLNQELDL